MEDVRKKLGYGYSRSMLNCKCYHCNAKFANTSARNKHMRLKHPRAGENLYALVHFVEPRGFWSFEALDLQRLRYNGHTNTWSHQEHEAVANWKKRFDARLEMLKLETIRLDNIGKLHVNIGISNRDIRVPEGPPGALKQIEFFNEGKYKTHAKDKFETIAAIQSDARSKQLKQTKRKLNQQSKQLKEQITKLEYKAISDILTTIVTIQNCKRCKLCYTKWTKRRLQI